jgi:hypothetical protein
MSLESYKKLCVYADDSNAFKIPKAELTNKSVLMYVKKVGGVVVAQILHDLDITDSSDEEA